MKTRKYKTIDGPEIELQIPETPEEEAEIQRKVEAGEIDGGDSFAEAHRKMKK